MKALLMHRDRDFDLRQELPYGHEDLIQDLELTTLFTVMAGGDKFLAQVVRIALLSSLDDLDTILYRQHILKDCLQHASIVRHLYDVAVEAIESEKKSRFGFFSRHPSSILRGSIEVMELLVGRLKQIRQVADTHAAEFESDGFTALFAMLQKELADDYFATVQHHLKELKFRNGILMSAELGVGNKGTGYVLRKPHKSQQHWVKRVFATKPPAYTFYIADRDESGARALAELRDRGINLVANALAQSTDHILSFFNMLRSELAFYIGCLNLYRRLEQQGEPMCFPLPAAPDKRVHAYRELYDACLALTLGQKIVGNDLSAEDKTLVIITGANQGGKSTLLRSIGLAQLMMQCGMFVPAEYFSSNVCRGLFTHYKRQEDPSMKSGKLDEEMSRMSDIVNHLTPDSMVLFNESFAATNEREGSEIARQIVVALLEERIKVFFVTHLYEFAHGLYDQKMDNATFLRAERQPEGERTYKVTAGEPLQTSYGEDLYIKIFEPETS